MHLPPLPNVELPAFTNVFDRHNLLVLPNLLTIHSSGRLVYFTVLMAATFFDES